MARLERKHSLATRIFHWANAPSLAVMNVAVVSPKPYKRTRPELFYMGID